MSMRTVPKLQFIYDKTSVKGQALSTLIERALKEDSLHQHDDEPASDAAPDNTKGE